VEPGNGGRYVLQSSKCNFRVLLYNVVLLQIKMQKTVEVMQSPNLDNMLQVGLWGSLAVGLEIACIRVWQSSAVCSEAS